MKSHLYRALVLISAVNYGISVPPEFCLHPLNKDDCNVTPKPVFTYYHPGSRCEIEFWRGCPTRNMFHDELTCSSVCLYNIYSGPKSRAETNKIGSITSTNDPCKEHFSNNYCGKPAQTKYYFAGGTCVRTEWTGCQSNNLFDDLPACIRACNPVIYFAPEVKVAIKVLTKKEINDVDKLIDHAIQEEIKDSELSLFSNETNNRLMDIYNDTSDEGDHTNFADDYDFDVGDYVEALSAEHENEPEKLAAPDDSEEGTQEEVFTLS